MGFYPLYPTSTMHVVAAIVGHAAFVEWIVHTLLKAGDFPLGY